jgi:L-fuculokinase
MDDELICILDIGKSNAKLQLVDAASGDTRWSAQRESAAIAASPLRQLDVAGIERWLLDALENAPGKERISAIVPVTHGAALVLLDAHGQVLSAPDYEDTAFDVVREQYAPLRDPFDASFSPLLPQGLNLGLQLFYLQTRQADLHARASAILTYPQYWAWRLCGVMASEVTSLGCHSDLWHPMSGRFSALAHSRGWARLMPPLRPASDTLGHLDAALARRTGLPHSCRVICGIHDSNASFLCHLAGRPPGDRFGVISSGTWTVIMARGNDLARLDPARDMLANVDLTGQPLATARFMGGREYQIICGDASGCGKPGHETIQRIVADNVMALPSFCASGGPFAHVPGRLTGIEHIGSADRASLATIYLALMCDYVLELLDVRGDTIIDGPLAGNEMFPGLLAQLRAGNRILTATTGIRATRAALYLANGRSESGAYRSCTAAGVAGLEDYRNSWRSKLDPH